MVSQKCIFSEGPNGVPIVTPSICLYNMLLNMKYDSLLAKDRRSLNSLFFQDIALSSFHTYNNNVPQHLSKGEFYALKKKKKTNCHSKI